MTKAELENLKLENVLKDKKLFASFRRNDGSQFKKYFPEFEKFLQDKSPKLSSSKFNEYLY